MKKLIRGTKCNVANCKEKAVIIAYDRVDKKLLACCEKHAILVAERDCPEYTTECPNCGCNFGVN